MPTGCFDYLSDPCVQDMLRRRDETIEILRDEISELDKQKQYRKSKVDEDNSKAKKKWFGLWAICFTSLYILIWVLIWIVSTI